MKLQGRNLELNSRGEDVRALQSDLRRLGVTVDDPEGFFGSATVRAVQVFQREHGITPANGVVDRKTAQRINEMLAVLSGPKPYVVRGRVLDVEGKGVNAQSVRAFAVDLEGERSLGRTESNARGGYEISYEPEGEDMAIQVRVFATTQSRKPLVSSPLILDPSAEETINLAIGDAPFRGRPEFDRTTEAIDAEVPTANLAEMRAEAKLLLARKTGISEKQVERLSEAQRLAERTGAEAAVFYGLFQTDGAVDLASLLTEGTANLRSRLTEAVRENVLPASIGDRMDSIVEKLRDSAVDEILAGRGASAEGDVGALLATTQLSDRQKRRFLSAHMENEDPTPAFWNRLREESEFNDAAVNELQLTLQLGALTLNHAPLVAAVRRSHRIVDARELAGLDVSDWLGLMDDVEPPEGFSGSGRKEAYARTVVNLAAMAFPSARLLSKWTRDTALVLRRSGPSWTPIQTSIFEKLPCAAILPSTRGRWMALPSPRRSSGSWKECIASSAWRLMTRSSSRCACSGRLGCAPPTPSSGLVAARFSGDSRRILARKRPGSFSRERVTRLPSPSPRW